MPPSYTLGERSESFVRQQVETGRYANASDVVRDALRFLKDRTEEREAALEALRNELEKGPTPDKSYPAEEIFDRLNRRYRNPNFADLAAGMRELTKGRRHTPAEVLQREGREARQAVSSDVDSPDYH